jgi:phosphopantothenoylcysteine decarboxylase/phosphopantothenate--cysteine ligase
MPKKKSEPSARSLAGRTILLGVSGSIAAYKAAGLASALRRRRAAVTVIMTAAAREFVTPLTFQTLTKNAVVTDMFGPQEEFKPEHVALADRADALVIAPATANVIGKIAAGLADDILSATAMTVDAPVLLAPAMNTRMWNNPVVKANVARLKRLGYAFVGPVSGRLASGAVGAGRFADVETVVRAVEDLLAAGG